METAIIEVAPFETDLFRIINHSDDNYEIETVEVAVKENGSWQQLPNSSFEFIDSYEDYVKPVDENAEMETKSLLVWERFVEAQTDDLYQLGAELAPDKDYRITTCFAVRLPNSDCNTLEREMVVTEVSRE